MRKDYFILAALMLCEFLVLGLSSVHPKPFGDYYFHDEAKGIAETIHTFDASHLIPFEHAAPGPSLYYAVPYTLLPTRASEKTHWEAAVVWNAAWFYMALLLLYKSAELFSIRAAVICPLLALLSPLGVYYSCGVAAETPAFVGSALFVYGWARLASNTASRRGWSTLFWGLFILGIMRPNAVASDLVVATLGLAMWIKGRNSLSRSVTIAAALALIATIGAAEVSRRWGDQQGSKEKQDFMALVLIAGSFQFRTEHWDWRQWTASARVGSSDFRDFTITEDKLKEESKALNVSLGSLNYRYFATYLKEHPGAWLIASGVRLLCSQVFIVTSIRPASFRMLFLHGVGAYYLFHILLNCIQVFMLAGLCYVLIVDRQHLFAHAILIAPWAGLVIFTTLTYSEARYIMPGQPELAMITTIAIADFVRRRNLAKAEESSSAPATLSS